MNEAEFFRALSRRTRLVSNHRDPLAEARRIIESDAETAEAQALRKVLTALANKRGEFSESEEWLFSAETCALAAALVNARLEGRYSPEEWLDALCEQGARNARSG